MSEKNSLTGMPWCPECERRVKPATTYAAAPIGVCVVSLHRCPDCEMILSDIPKTIRRMFSHREAADL
jgi:hypothetical protein